MRTRLFIVTYRNPGILNDNLHSLFASDYQGEVYVINNHSSFHHSDEFNGKITVLHNMVRPDFSCGHLARDWNCALINGFESLSEPKSDIVIHCQDDTLFHVDWFNKIQEMHQTYSFIQYGWGDNFCSYTPEAIKKIGLWDERFCNIGNQESDFFLRALMYNREKSSINDHVHGRLLNRVDPEPIYRPEHDKYEYHEQSTKRFNRFSDAVFVKKWGFFPGGWNEDFLNDPPQKSLIENYVLYPYFERDVEGLRDKNYLVPDLI